MKLTGKTVLLTGATGGLGRAIAAALAGRGTHLVLSSRKADDLAELAASLPGGGHRTIVSDLADYGAPERLVAEAGGLDAFVANAALPASGRLETFTGEELTRALNVNLEAPIRMTHALLPGMRERGAGHLVYVSSLAGKVPSPRSSMYNATKFGLRGFALAIRQDLRGSGVGASIVLPGFVRDAGMFADSGGRAPGVGTSSPAEVGAAVVRAIERDKGEITVAPLRQRALSRIAMAAPELSSRVAGRKAAEVADEIAGGQRNKR